MRRTTAPRIAPSSRNQITSNIIDGGYHGHNVSGQGGDAPGQDDGILLSNQDGERLSPITGFINGGGNVCDAGLNIPSFRDFYLNCGSSTGSASVGADRAARHADLGSGSIPRSAPGFSSASRYRNRDPLH
jgi:hypothetical protein